jgi:ABC-type multidrug transport system ATPase subunit
LNDLVLEDDSVSARHARIVFDSEGMWLEDLGSRNGTFLGRSGRSVVRERFQEGDVIRLGQATVPTGAIERAVRSAGPGPASSPNTRSLRMSSSRPLIMGRHQSCDMLLSSPRASARHLSVTLEGRQVVVRDLGSTNGTFINGVQLKGPTILAPGAVLTAAGTRFTLGSDQRSLVALELSGAESLEVNQVSFAVKGKPLLENVSMVVQPGELIAIMGPSGAGKSTLLALLNGSSAPSAGTVRLGGIDLHRHFDLFRGRIGYVPQDDIMHANLTVHQALRYAARLRLPRDFSRREILQRVAQVIKQLGLEGTENTRIGDQQRRGISGGQRKRVNVALELMSDPTTLILDEPTSGLSSADAASMLELLRKLADSGKIVIVTIHQPSMEVFSRFDAVAVVARDASTRQVGRLAWYGRAVPDSLRFFERHASGGQGAAPHIDRLLTCLAERPVSEWISRWTHSSAYDQWVARRLGRGAPPNSAAGRRRPQSKNRFIQLFTLIRRTIAVKIGDSWNTATLLLQAPLIAALISVVYAKALSETPANAGKWVEVSAKVCTASFVTSLAAIWFGISASAREIVGEWPIYRRERMVGLSMFSYVSSKVILAVLLATIQCGLLLVIVYPACSLGADWSYLYRVLVAAAAVGAGIGLIISALVQTAEAAAASLPILLLPMIVLGGVLVKMNDMPEILRPVAAVLPSRWAVEGFAAAEAGTRPRLQKPKLPPGAPAAAAAVPNELTTGGAVIPASQGSGSDDDDMIERCFPRKDGRTTPEDCLLILEIMAGVSFVAVGGVLWTRDMSARR